MSDFVFFPSCNFAAASPEAARRLRAAMAERMPVAGCCRTDPLDLPEGATALYFCQACRETLEARAPGKLVLQNLFVWLDGLRGFRLPDHSGLTVTVQDCWRDRDHPEIFDATRSLLRKMGVRVLEMPDNRERSGFCGDIHFTPRCPENIELLKQHASTPLRQLSDEVKARLFAEQVERLPCETVVTVCNRCKIGLSLGGARALHLMELVFSA